MKLVSFLWSHMSLSWPWICFGLCVNVLSLDLLVPRNQVDHGFPDHLLWTKSGKSTWRTFVWSYLLVFISSSICLQYHHWICCVAVCNWKCESLVCSLPFCHAASKICLQMSEYSDMPDLRCCVTVNGQVVRWPKRVVLCGFGTGKRWWYKPQDRCPHCSFLFLFLGEQDQNHTCVLLLMSFQCLSNVHVSFLLFACVLLLFPGTHRDICLVKYMWHNRLASAKPHPPSNWPVSTCVSWHYLDRKLCVFVCVCI